MTEKATTPEPRTIKTRLYGCLRSGALAGGKQALWLLVLMIPISLAVKLLAFYGALAWVAQWIEPGMKYAGLPGETAAPMITAAALNIYSGIAALGSLTAVPSAREVTIIAFFMLTFHNLPIEVAVQKRAGSSAWKIIVIRLATAVIGAVILNLVMPHSDAPARLGTPDASATTLGAVFAEWSVASGRLIAKVLVLVMALMILQKLLAEFGIAKLLSKALAPLLAVLGLPRSTAFLWITMNTLGLAYGGAILVEEAKSGELKPEEIELLNRSAAVCHSLLEDTLLFVAIGAWAAWIIVPRLVMAAALAWGYRVWKKFVPSSPVGAGA